MEINQWVDRWELKHSIQNSIGFTTFATKTISKQKLDRKSNETNSIRFNPKMILILVFFFLLQSRYSTNNRWRGEYFLHQKMEIFMERRQFNRYVNGNCMALDCLFNG